MEIVPGILLEGFSIQQCYRWKREHKRRLRWIYLVVKKHLRREGFELVWEQSWDMDDGWRCSLLEQTHFRSRWLAPSEGSCPLPELDFLWCLNPGQLTLVLDSNSALILCFFSMRHPQINCSSILLLPGIYEEELRSTVGLGLELMVMSFREDGQFLQVHGGRRGAR